MTNSNEPKFSVGLYVHGRDLNPDLITAHLGMAPTAAHVRGAVIPSKASQPIVARAGLWSLRRDGEGALLTMILRQLVNELNRERGPIDAVPGVEDAYLDVFVTGSDTGEIDFDLSALNLAALGQLGMPLRVKFAPVSG